MLRVTSTDDGFSVRNRRAVLCAAPVWCPALFLRLPTPAVLLDMQGDTAKGSISLAVAAVAGVTVALAGAPSYVGRCLAFSDCVLCVQRLTHGVDGRTATASTCSMRPVCCPIASSQASGVVHVPPRRRLHAASRCWALRRPALPMARCFAGLQRVARRQ